MKTRLEQMSFDFVVEMDYEEAERREQEKKESQQRNEDERWEHAKKEYPVTEAEKIWLPPGIRLACYIHENECKGCDMDTEDHTERWKYEQKVCLKDVHQIESELGSFVLKVSPVSKVGKLYQKLSNFMTLVANLLVPMQPIITCECPKPLARRELQVVGCNVQKIDSCYWHSFTRHTICHMIRFLVASFLALFAYFKDKPIPIIDSSATLSRPGILESLRFCGTVRQLHH